MRYTTILLVGGILLTIGVSIVFLSEYLVSSLDPAMVTIGKGLVILGTIAIIIPTITILSPCGRYFG